MSGSNYHRVGSKADAKRAEYEAVMLVKKAAVIGGGADPFLEFAVTAFVEEMRLLEKIGPAWKVQFCQLSMGPGALCGGLYVAYDRGGFLRSIIHPERFDSAFASAENKINFWGQHIRNGFIAAENVSVPFIIVAEFRDGIYYTSVKEIPTEVRVGSRLCKPAAEATEIVNVVYYFDTSAFKQVRLQP